MSRLSILWKHLQLSTVACSGLQAGNSLLLMLCKQVMQYTLGRDAGMELPPRVSGI